MILPISLIESIQFFSSFWMLTIIWFVQIVHYPLFKWVPIESRALYSERHQFYISWLVVPGMLLELGSLVWILIFGLYHWVWMMCTFLLAIIWSSTFLIQVPCHQQLLIAPSDSLCDRLIRTNWIRTLSWTVKTLVIGYVMFNRFY